MEQIVFCSAVLTKPDQRKEKTPTAKLQDAQLWFLIFFYCFCDKYFAVGNKSLNMDKKKEKKINDLIWV